MINNLIFVIQRIYNILIKTIIIFFIYNINLLYFLSKHKEVKKSRGKKKKKEEDREYPSLF